MEAINAALRKIKYRGEQKLTQYLLTEEDMTRISTVNRFLTKLDIFSTTLGGDQYVTSSVLLSVIAAQAHAPRQSVCPGRIKCLRAPSHQILAKSAPPKARNRGKVEFATKVRKSNINCCLTMNIKKAFNTSLFSLKL